MSRILRSVSPSLSDHYLSLQSLLFSPPIHSDADSFRHCLDQDHYPWYAPVGNLTFGWYDRHMRDMLRESIQQFSELIPFYFLLVLRYRPDTPM